MKERPILFSGPMVRALLNDNKTQTRRVLKVPHENPMGKWEVLPFGGPNGGHTRDGKTVPYQNVISHTRTGEIIACPYGQPGDRLWVRESFAHVYNTNAEPLARSPEDVAYMADGMTADRHVYGAWKPSIHMPRWASRIILDITSVRVERLQDISDADCIAEGCTQNHNGYYRGGPHPESGMKQMATAKDAYRDLWESINGPNSWAANPWLWVISFTPVAQGGAKPAITAARTRLEQQ